MRARCLIGRLVLAAALPGPAQLPPGHLVQGRRDLLTAFLPGVEMDLCRPGRCVGHAGILRTLALDLGALYEMTGLVDGLDNPHRPAVEVKAVGTVTLWHPLG